MDLEKELRDLKSQIYEIEEKLRNAGNNMDKEYNYESDLIEKVYEICQDQCETSFLEKVLQVCSLENDAKNQTNIPSEGVNCPISQNNSPTHHLLVPRIIDYSILSEADDTFIEVMTGN